MAKARKPMTAEEKAEREYFSNIKCTFCRTYCGIGPTQCEKKCSWKKITYDLRSTVKLKDFITYPKK